MPYNTRRKSLSLPSLGIQLPPSSRAFRSPTVATSPETVSESSSHHQHNHNHHNPATMPPAKRFKRSHPSPSLSLSPTSPAPSTIATHSNASRTAPAPAPAPALALALARAQHTPPPSPGHAPSPGKIDTQGIDDDIVVAVIEQLERSGNRPHLLKELAAVLCTQLAIVESSANQSAIISSRLTTYLRRPWSALSPCPVGKELIGTHPKRIYFYLAARPHQPFPDPEAVNAAQALQRAEQARIISPSLSSKAGSAAEDEDDDNDHDRAESQPRARHQLSPSPELDLDFAMHDDALDGDVLDPHRDARFDVDADPDVNSLCNSYSGRASLSRDAAHLHTSENMSHNRRAVSPPLEGVEREFTQTASELQMLMVKKRAEEQVERERRASREFSLSSASASVGTASNGPATPSSALGGGDAHEVDVRVEMGSNVDPSFDINDGVPMMVDESEETCALRNHEAAAALFGNDIDIGMLSLASPITMANAQKMSFASSPFVKPTVSVNVIAAAREDQRDKSSARWDELMELRSPETVELHELDELFDSL